MLTSKADHSFRARFSITKLVLIEVVLITLTVTPNLPGFGVGLRYTAIFYSRYSAVRIVACAILGLIFLSLLPLLLRALAGQPALEIDNGNIIVYNPFCILIKKTELVSIEGPNAQGIVSIQLSDKRKVVNIPILIYREKGRVLAEFDRLKIMLNR